jgi:hypothetical protein
MKMQSKIKLDSWRAIRLAAVGVKKERDDNSRFLIEADNGISDTEK